jgi:hypothetical protein
MRRIGGAAVAAALVFMVPVTANAADSGDVNRPAASAEVYRTGDPVGESHAKADAPKDADFQVPAWSYHITASCAGLEGPIRQGANYWGSATETSGSGTPVECTGGYVSGCGGGNVVGCNWGSGQRIMLSTLVNDFALLAAHEFGHNWYGHSGEGCANWSSPDAVMLTMMC